VACADDHYDAIHSALVQAGPQTIHELAQQTRLTHVQVARRLPEMRGRAVVTAQTRPGPAGRKCRVWRACGKA
jgi:predicted ArsR family transcriptional regulator